MNDTPEDGYLSETCSVVCFTIKTRLVANKGSWIIFRYKPAQQDAPTQDKRNEVVSWPKIGLIATFESENDLGSEMNKIE
jgi:hypothetical protein